MPNNQVDTIPRSGDAPLASNTRSRSQILVGTRFAAALFVVFFHFGKNTPLIADRAWSPILLSGPLAVSYFYVLSGFIMATVYRSIETKEIWYLLAKPICQTLSSLPSRALLVRLCPALDEDGPRAGSVSNSGLGAGTRTQHDRAGLVSVD